MFRVVMPDTTRLSAALLDRYRARSAHACFTVLIGATIPFAANGCAKDSPGMTSPAPPPVVHRVGVRITAGHGEFFDRSTNVAFTPRGANYIRLATRADWSGNPTTYHSTFDVGYYDPVLTDSVLMRMQQDGYNTTRVFLNGCCPGSLAQEGSGLSSAYIANLADFLQRAKAHGVVVLITTDAVPDIGEYINSLYAGCCRVIGAQNVTPLAVNAVRAHGKFWNDLIMGLRAANAPLESIFAYELMNELSFVDTVPPLNLTVGSVTTGNGMTYDMSIPADHQRMMDDNLTYWVTHVRAAIQHADTGSLVTVGFFQPQGPNPSRAGDPRVIEPYPAIANSTADFVDLHPYAGYELNLSQYAQNFGEQGYLQKPVIMGEFGAVKSSFPTIASGTQALVAWEAGSCAYGYSGWLLWSWDEYQPAFPFWTMTSGDSSVEKGLSPAVRADPCSP